MSITLVILLIGLPNYIIPYNLFKFGDILIVFSIKCYRLTALFAALVIKFKIIIKGRKFKGYFNGRLSLPYLLFP